MGLIVFVLATVLATFAGALLDEGGHAFLLVCGAEQAVEQAAFETVLAMGVQFERRLFHGLFGTEDQTEGMAAFVEKRPGKWTGL